MKPDLARFLGVAAQHLMTRTAPALPAGYEQSSAAALGAMMIAVGQEVERAAARRVEENAALRTLFEDAAPHVQDETLAERLERAAGSEDTSFTVTDLEAANAELRGLLIELHERVEALATPDARRIDAAIWRELARSTERRRLLMGPF